MPQLMHTAFALRNVTFLIACATDASEVCMSCVGVTNRKRTGLKIRSCRLLSHSSLPKRDVFPAMGDRGPKSIDHNPRVFGLNKAPMPDSVSMSSGGGTQIYIITLAF
ncbi:unnamed protein product [Calypogeia fissa]